MTTARSVRRLSRSRTSGAGRTSLSDAYSNTLLTVLALAYAGSLLTAPAQWSKLTTSAARHWVDDASRSSWAVAALAVCALLSLFGLAVRVGPVALSRAQAQWWPPLPVDRRGLILPAYLASLTAPVLGLTAATALVNSSFGDSSATLTICLITSSLVALTHSAAVGLQIRGHARSRAAAYAEWLVPGVLFIILAATAAGTSVGMHLTLLPVGVAVPSAGGFAWVLATVILSVAVVGSTVRGLSSVTARALRDSAARTEQLWVAILSMDGAALHERRTCTSSRSRRRNSSSRIFTTPGPRRAALHVQLRLLRAAATGLLTCALLPTAVLAVPALNTTVILTCTLLACSFRASALAGGFAQLVDQSPNLLRHFPLSDRSRDQLLHAGACLLLLAWSSITFAAMALSGAAPQDWPCLIPPLAIGMAVTTVTSAHRPATDWNAPMLATAMGVLPTGMLRTLAHGKITTLAVLAPSIAAVGAGTTSPALITTQIITTALVVGWALTRTQIRLHRPWPPTWLWPFDTRAGTNS